MKAMLRHVGERAGERRLIVFSVACCRRVWSAIADECSREAVERYAQSRFPLAELIPLVDASRKAFYVWHIRLRHAIDDETPDEGLIGRSFHAAGAANYTAGCESWEDAATAAERAVDTACCEANLTGPYDQAIWDAVRLRGQAAQCDLLRDIIDTLSVDGALGKI